MARTWNPRFEEELGELVLGPLKRLRVRALVMDDERRAVDVRQFVESEKYRGPTRNGSMISPDQARELAKFLEAAADAAELA